MIDFDLSLFSEVLSKSSDQIVAFHSRDQIGQYYQFCIDSFGNYDLHIWHKTNAIPFTNNVWKSDLEYIAVGWRAKKHQKVSQDMKSKAWISSLCTDKFHAAAKPVRLMQKYIEVLTSEGQTVVDPFMGGGATGAGCIRTKRTFIGIEKDESRFNIACSRLSDEWQKKCSELPFAEPVKLTQKTLVD